MKVTILGSTLALQKKIKDAKFYIYELEKSTKYCLCNFVPGEFNF